MSKKKMITLAIIALLLIVAMLIGGIFAYFTKTTTPLTNTFTIGNVNITLTEPAWTSAIEAGQTAPAAAQNMVPGDNVAKDPTITNTGANDAYVFMKVVVPCYAGQQLFALNHTDSDSEVAGVNSGWNLISQTPTTIGASTTAVEYVYAYANGTAVSNLTALEPNETATLFTSVTLNTNNTVVEAAAAAANTAAAATPAQENPLNIVVTGYAIQTNLASSLNTQEAVYNAIVNP